MRKTARRDRIPARPQPTPVRLATTSPWPAWLVDGLVTVALFLAATALYRDCERDQVTDSTYTLLLTETLLDGHTFALDRHFPTPLDASRYPGGRRQMPTYQAEAGYPYQLEVLPRDPAHPDRPRIFHWYPAFPSVLAIPFVVALHAQGLHATAPDGGYDPRAETQMQLRMAAWLTALAVGLIYLLGRVWLGRWSAVLLALTFAVATPLWSTGSRAVWTSDWGLLFGLGILLHLARVDAGKGRLQPWWIGSLAAFQYFCRPALAVEILAVTAWVAWKDRRAGLRTAAVGALWALGFGLWSHHLTGHWLPNYHRHSGLGFGHFWQGLQGVLVSPGRGLLVYCPFLLAALLVLLRYRKQIPSASLVVMALLGTLAHAVVLALYPNWWGGHSFGPRLMIDTLPFLALACAVALRCVVAEAPVARPTPPPSSRELRALAWLLTTGLVMLGAWIHWRGVTDRRTFRWNAWPTSIDEDPARALDWRMPPFLAGIWAQPPPEPMPLLAWDHPLQPGREDAQPYLLEGWSDAEGSFRWSDGHRLAFCFRLAEVRAHEVTIRLRPYVGGKGPAVQHVQVRRNGREVARVELTRAGLQPLTLMVPAGEATRDEVWTLWLPDAVAPVQLQDGSDWRELGVAVHEVRVRPLP